MFLLLMDFLVKRKKPCLLFIHSVRFRSFHNLSIDVQTQTFTYKYPLQFQRTPLLSLELLHNIDFRTERITHDNVHPGDKISALICQFQIQDKSETYQTHDERE